MKFIIRKLTQNDLPQLLNHIKITLEEDFLMYKKRSIEAQKKMYNKNFFSKILKNEKGILLGAFDKKKLIGFIVMDDKDGGVGFVEWLAVKKSYRGKGIGTSLLKQLEKKALSKYYHYLFFYTESQKNIEFYKKRGFEYVGLQRKSWFGENEYMLQKALRGNPFEEIFKKYKV